MFTFFFSVSFLLLPLLASVRFRSIPSTDHRRLHRVLCSVFALFSPFASSFPFAPYAFFLGCFISSFLSLSPSEDGGLGSPRKWSGLRLSALERIKVV
uniref:Secreted protein n=1 Tax=Anopheles darlingi TaxID=43151 RepID=A0A2M4D0C0_ANODA